MISDKLLNIVTILNHALDRLKSFFWVKPVIQRLNPITIRQE